MNEKLNNAFVIGVENGIANRNKNAISIFNANGILCTAKKSVLTIFSSLLHSVDQLPILHKFRTLNRSIHVMSDEHE